MISRISTSQLLLKSMLVLLIVSPIVALLSSVFIGNSTDLSLVIVFWCLSTYLYGAGMWLAFVLLHRGFIHRQRLSYGGAPLYLVCSWRCSFH